MLGPLLLHRLLCTAPAPLSQLAVALSAKISMPPSWIPGDHAARPDQREEFASGVGQGDSLLIEEAHLNDVSLLLPEPGRC